MPITCRDYAKSYECERASYWAATDKDGFHCYVIVSPLPMLEYYMLDFDTANELRLSEVAENAEELSAKNRIVYVGDAPFSFSHICEEVGRILPAGYDNETYGPITMNCRTVVALALVAAGFSEPRVDKVFKRLGVEPFLSADDVGMFFRSPSRLLLAFRTYATNTRHAQ